MANVGAASDDACAEFDSLLPLVSYPDWNLPLLGWRFVITTKIGSTHLRCCYLPGKLSVEHL